MKLHQLRYFVATVEHGTMTGAAAALHVAQPALTRAVRELERELGVPLFIRSGRGLHVTSEGRQVADVAQRVLRDLESLRSIGANRPVHVSATRTHAQELCTPVVARLVGNEQLPDVDVVLSTRDVAADVIADVVAGRAELGVCEVSSTATTTRGLTTVVLGVQELVLLCPPGSDLADPLPFEALADIPLVVPQPGSRRRDGLDELLASHGVSPRIVVESDHRELNVPLVLRGVAAAFGWSSDAREVAALGVRVVRLEPRWVRTVAVVHRAGALGHRERRVVAALRAEAQEILQPINAGSPRVASTTAP